MVEMTNFSLNKFRAIWSVLSDKVQMDWNSGRGRKRQHKPQDVLFMLLCNLEACWQLGLQRKMFYIKGPTFERMMLGFADLVCGTLYSLAVEKYEKKYTMGRLVQGRTTLRHYKFALYATDVTFNTQTALPVTMKRPRCTLAINTSSTDISQRYLFYLTV